LLFVLMLVNVLLAFTEKTDIGLGFHAIFFVVYSS